MNFGIWNLNFEFCKDAKLCYMDADSFIAHVKTDDIYKDIAGDVEARFDTSDLTLWIRHTIF